MGRGDDKHLEVIVENPPIFWPRICLLYTSDAADERSSVDLGGRRIIKKQKTYHVSVDSTLLKRL